MEISADVDYGYLRQLVFGLSQNVLDPSRDYLFGTRLTKVLRNKGMTHLEELVQHLKQRKDPVLERAIAEAMTINETSFFRDGKPFDLLRETILPELIEKNREQRRPDALRKIALHRVHNDAIRCAPGAVITLGVGLSQRVQNDAQLIAGLPIVDACSEPPNQAEVVAPLTAVKG